MPFRDKRYSQLRYFVEEMRRIISDPKIVNTRAQYIPVRIIISISFQNIFFWFTNDSCVIFGKILLANDAGIISNICIKERANHQVPV